MRESDPTCETRLPRGPGLACRATRPCKQSQILKFCHMPALLSANLWQSALLQHTSQWNGRVSTHLWDLSAQGPRSGLWSRSPLQAGKKPHTVSHACASQGKALTICYAIMYIWIECQSMIPPVRPVCPEGPVWPVEPLAPASSHRSSNSVTCLPFSGQSADNVPCYHTSQMNARIISHLWDPSVQKARSGLWSRSPLQAVKMPHTVSHACPSHGKALTICYATIYILIECQCLNPPVRPVCPEGPVWPVEPLAPASSHRSSNSVTCPPFSGQSANNLPCYHTSQWHATVSTHLWDPSAQKARSGLWSRSPLQAVKMPHTVSHACPSQCNPLTICSAFKIHLNGMPESRPTCETRLPRSPGLACGAARPCKQSQNLTSSLMPALLSANLWQSAVLQHTSQWHARVSTHLWDPSAQKPRPGLWSRSPLQAVTPPQIASHACPSQGKALTICYATMYISMAC